MGNKDSYAKGILLHQWVETVDWDNLKADFVVLRLGQTGYPNYPTSEYVDQKYAEFVGKAAAKGMPVIAWYELYPKIYGDTSWPVNDYSRWYDRSQDMSMQVIDRMLLNRPYWHGMIISVNPGVYDPKAKTYDASALWVSRSVLRVRDLVRAAYKKTTWPEFPAGVIDNKDWDTQGLLEMDTQNWQMSVWDYKGVTQTIGDKLDVNALSYPESHIASYLMPTRSGSFWRVQTALWEGAKSKTGAKVALPVYLYYGSKDSLYKVIGFEAANPTPDPDSEPDPSNGGEPEPGAGGDLSIVNAKLQTIIDMMEPISAFFAKLNK